VIIYFIDPQFWDALKARPLSKTDCLSDIYDGMEYKKHSKPGGFLCKQTYPANVSFLFNTDGVALFRSSSTDIWPIFLAVNELPPSMRLDGNEHNSIANIISSLLCLTL